MVVIMYSMCLTYSMKTAVVIFTSFCGLIDAQYRYNMSSLGYKYSHTDNYEPCIVFGMTEKSLRYFIAGWWYQVKITQGLNLFLLWNLFLYSQNTLYGQDLEQRVWNIVCADILHHNINHSACIKPQQNRQLIFSFISCRFEPHDDSIYFPKVFFKVCSHISPKWLCTVMYFL